MRRHPKGFSLVELLIVVAIIGILATVVISGQVFNMQKTRQTATMTDMKTLAEACIAYNATNGEAPAAGKQSGPVSETGEFYQDLLPYLTEFPLLDHWGNSFIVYTGTAVANFAGFPAEDIDDMDFIIVSYGRKGIEEGFIYDPNNPRAGRFALKKMADFDNDLIIYNGAWLRAPALMKSGS